MPGVAPRMLAASSGSCSSAEIWISVLHSIDYKQNMHECVCVQLGRLNKFLNPAMQCWSLQYLWRDLNFRAAFHWLPAKHVMHECRYCVLSLAPQPPVWSCAEPSNSSELLSSGSLISLSFAWIIVHAAETSHFIFVTLLQGRHG